MEPKEGLDVEGQGVNRSSANWALSSLWPLTLVPRHGVRSMTQQRSCHTWGFATDLSPPPQPCVGVSLGLGTAPAWKCPCCGLLQSLGEGGSLISSSWLSHFTLAPSPGAKSDAC